MNLKRIEALGYRVRMQTQDRNDPAATPYVLSGTPGHEYALVRQLANPDLMFPVDAHTQNVVRVGGYSWFTDADGELRPLA